MITLTPCPAGATPLRPGTAHIAISHARSPRPGWQDQGIPAPHVNAGAAEQGQPGDVLPEDRSAARHHQRASNQVGQTADALARDHGISRATAYRYLDEVVIVLAEQAPDLREALERAKDKGFSHLILDGKIIPCDRCKEPAVSVRGEVIDLWYSGKAHAHGGNVQAVLAPDGFPLWVSQVEPGSVHDIT